MRDGQGNGTRVVVPRETPPCCKRCAMNGNLAAQGSGFTDAGSLNSARFLENRNTTTNNTHVPLGGEMTTWNAGT